MIEQTALVVFATREGQTEKVARRLARHLQHHGVTTTLVNAGDAATTASLDPRSFDLLVCGASMHAGGLERELVDFVNDHAEAISLRARSLFVVLLSAAARDPQLKASWLADARKKVDRQLTVAFEDTEMIAGALTYSKYPRPLKWIMRKIASKAGAQTDTSKDYEYTDWRQVEQYARRLARRDLPGKTAASRPTSAPN